MFVPTDSCAFRLSPVPCSTPAKLLSVIDGVLGAYYRNEENPVALTPGMMEEARRLMKPAVIQRIEMLRDVLVDQFM